MTKTTNHSNTPHADRQPSNSDYQRWIFRARNAGNWFMFFRPFYRIMSKLDALFLQDLINLAALTDPTDDEYFLCTIDFLAANGWSDTEQKDRFRHLKKLGLVQTTLRGIPPKRWVRIELDRIERALDEAETRQTRPIQAGSNDPIRTGSNGPQRTGSNDPNPRIKDQGKRPGEGGATGRTPFAGATDEKAASRRATTDKSGMDDALIPPTRSALDARPRCTTEPIDHERADKLRSGLRAAGRSITQRAAKYWAEPMALLRRQLDDPSKIDRVLDWFVTNPPPKPKLLNAVQFRQRWDWLERLYDAFERTRPVAVVADVLKPIIRDLLDYEWPKGSRDAVASVTQRSYDAIVVFLKALKACTPPKGLDGLKREVLGEIGDPLWLVHTWMCRVHERVRRWDGWNGDLSAWVWRRDHADVLTQLRGMADRYSRAADWDKLASVLPPI